jgi:uncharacterized protein (UPF0262 family)
MPMKSTAKSKIRSFDLRGAEDLASTALLRRDHETALRDLKSDSFFQPVKDHHGPYAVVLSVEENRLVFRITNDAGHELPMLVLSVKPYQRLIKDYFLIVHSYDEAVREGKPSRIEAIDMGRRGLHNEGAELLMERLSDKILLDLNTARRLFSLICVLHSGKALVWR